jgi:hypothetical protein
MIGGIVIEDSGAAIAAGPQTKEAAIADATNEAIKELTPAKIRPYEPELSPEFIAQVLAELEALKKGTIAG